MSLLSGQVSTGSIPTDMEYVPVYDTAAIGFDRLMWFEEVPGLPGQFLVAQQSGELFVLNIESGTKTPYGYVAASQAAGYHEAGLLGLAFHPDFINNRKIYAYHSDEASNRLTISELLADPSEFKDSGTPAKIIWQGHQQGQHNGGTVRFGPDGYLYWATGQPNAGNNRGLAQDLASTVGKMFRIDVDNPDAGTLYSVPADNPFMDIPGAVPEIYAYGFRNPMKFDFDPVNNNLWNVEVGMWLEEDVQLVGMGDNMGWDVMEGFLCYDWNNERDSTVSCDKLGLKLPVWSIPHPDPTHTWLNSGTGGFVYRTNEASGFYGAYFFGDYCSAWVFALKEENGEMTEHVQFQNSPVGPIHFTLDSKGQGYLGGWYGYDAMLNPDRRGHILKMESSGFLPPSVSLNKNKTRLINTGTAGIFVKLDGIPVGYYENYQGKGSNQRLYTLTGKKIERGSNFKGVLGKTFQ